MSKANLTQDDLLDLIEGRLEAERAQVVRRAVEREPLLRARLGHMVRDRRAIRAAFEQAEHAAPPGLSRAAVTLAEREGLIGPATGLQSVPAPQRFRRYQKAAAIALSGAVGLVAVGWGLVALLGGPTENSVADATPHAAGPMRFDLPEDTVPTQRKIELPEYLRTQAQHLADLAADNGETASALGAADLAVAAVDPVVGPPEPSERGWADLLDRDRRGVSPSEAATLAMAGRLELVVPGASPSGWSATLMGATGISAVSRPESKARAAPEVSTFYVELTVPWDAELASLEDALLELRTRLESRARPGTAWFANLDDPDQAQRDASAGPTPAPEPIPSRRVEDVLWWSSPTTRWVRRLSVLVPVRIVSDGERRDGR